MAKNYMGFDEPHPSPERSSPIRTEHVGTNKVQNAIVYNYEASETTHQMTVSHTR
jgi:hypothetical protein